MAEWLILLLLVPAAVMPVVLLVGFAGCDEVLGLTRFPPAVFLDTPVGKTVNRITLSWNWSDPAPQGFHLERTNPDFSKTPLAGMPLLTSVLASAMPPDRVDEPRLHVDRGRYLLD
jgi:hypothetical protein